MLINERALSANSKKEPVDSLPCSTCHAPDGSGVKGQKCILGAGMLARKFCVAVIQRGVVERMRLLYCNGIGEMVDGEQHCDRSEPTSVGILWCWTSVCWSFITKSLYEYFYIHSIVTRNIQDMFLHVINTTSSKH